MFRNVEKLLMALFLLAPALHAQGVDEIVRQEMRRQKIPGLSLAVMKEGKIIKAEGYGLANVELNVGVKPETLFQSGSVGKQFTATGIMMLVEDGKIGLDDKITKYFPDSPASWNDITIRHVLTHTSGIKNYGPGDLNYRLDYTEVELLKKAQSFPLDFRSGDKWSYSNTGYVVLGILIHKVTGQFYGDFLKERIFKPLGMVNTQVMSEADILPNRSSGYRLVKGQIKNQEYASPSLNSTADGSLYFTVLDLAKWDAALYGEELLKRSSLEQMWTPVKLNDGTTHPYGFGWGFDDIRGHKMIEHGGAWQGFTTAICRYVNDKLTVVVLTNLDSSHSRPARILHAVAGTYIADLRPIPPPPIEDKEPEVTSRFRGLLKDLAEGADVAALLDGVAKEKFTADTLKRYQELLDDAGSLHVIEMLERKQEGNVRVYRYRVQFENREQEFRLDLTPENKVSALELNETE